MYQLFPLLFHYYTQLIHFYPTIRRRESRPRYLHSLRHLLYSCLNNFYYLTHKEEESELPFWNRRSLSATFSCRCINIVVGPSLRQAICELLIAFQHVLSAKKLYETLSRILKKSRSMKTLHLTSTYDWCSWVSTQWLWWDFEADSNLTASKHLQCDASFQATRVHSFFRWRRSAAKK